MTRSKGALGSILLPVILSAIVAIFLVGIGRPVSANGQETCPNTGDGWTKYDNWADSKKTQSHTAGEDQVVVEVCIKGGTNIQFYTADTPDTDVCWIVEGIGTQTATASENWEGDEKGPECKDISHASFRVADKPEEPEEPEEPETPTTPTPGTTLGTSTQVTAPVGGVKAGVGSAGSIAASVVGLGTSLGAVGIAAGRMRKQ